MTEMKECVCVSMKTCATFYVCTSGTSTKDKEANTARGEEGSCGFPLTVAFTASAKSTNDARRALGGDPFAFPPPSSVLTLKSQSDKMK